MRALPAVATLVSALVVGAAVPPVAGAALDVVVRSTFLAGGTGDVGCQAGEVAIGGGAGVDAPANAYISRSEPRPLVQGAAPTGWHMNLRSRATGAAASGTVYVLCSRTAVASLAIRSVFLPTGTGDSACLGGEVAIGGGAGVDGPADAYVSRSEPRPLAQGGAMNAWHANLRLRADGGPASGTVYALCATGLDVVERSAFLPGGFGDVPCLAGEVAVGGGAGSGRRQLA